jgi:hypothetical protein
MLSASASRIATVKVLRLTMWYTGVYTNLVFDVVCFKILPAFLQDLFWKELVVF